MKKEDVIESVALLVVIVLGITGGTLLTNFIQGKMTKPAATATV